MSRGKALQILLIDGQPSGRIACEVLNWSGKGYKLPRSRVKESSDRRELSNAGVYMLFGQDPENMDSHIVYVGEAEEAYKRVLQQFEKEFWNDVVLFISKDENLNKADVRYLEHKLIAAIAQAGRAKIMNANRPAEPSISELERVVLDEYLENLKLVVSTLGYRVFEPLVATDSTSHQLESKAVSTESEHALERDYFLMGPRNANAKASLTSEGLVVRKGSRLTKDVLPSARSSVADMRQHLEKVGTLIEDSGQLLFAKDHLFSSPSAAAMLIIGNSVNGRIVWKDFEGRTLKEIEDSSPTPPSSPVKTTLFAES